MKTLIYTFIIFLFTTTAFAADIKVDVIEDGKKLKIQMGELKNKIALSTPSETQLEGKPQIFGNKTFALVAVAYFDHDSGTTIVYAIDSDGTKLWSKDLGSFNFSQPLIEKDHVYLGAVGKVWKIDKKSGKEVWHHKNLYESTKYNGVIPITRDGETIVFSNNLEVSDSSGKVKEVK